MRLLTLATSLLSLQLHALEIALPTSNHHLLTGEPEKFYMYVDRTFEGETTKPWEGGAFGYTRTPIRINGEVVLTKFHEGIDIAPMKRDAAGNPLDLVNAIADGIVAHTSPIAGRSNYGKYVVVEHHFDQHTFYSLYAHLADITVQPGDPVKLGSSLGRLGYTGAGINRTRAHVHLELCLLMSRHYDGWHRKFSGGTNYHGIYNGMNFAGMDVARLFLEHKANPAIRIQDFVRNTPPYFKVAVPKKDAFDFADRNPWLLTSTPTADSHSWEIAFSATGLPLSITPIDQAVTTPTVTAVRNSPIAHRHLTRGLIDGQGSTARLTRGGLSLIALLTDDFPLPSTPDNPSTR